jgi:hypothetical protein
MTILRIDQSLEIASGAEPFSKCDLRHGCPRISLPSCKEIVPFQQETDMNEDTHECELSMDELDLVSGGGPIAPLTQIPALVVFQTVHGRGGIVDDSV